MSEKSPISPGTPSAFDLRNDRSERLWGSDGQKRLAEAHIVLLGASSVGCEILKNMVLPGLGRFTVVDPAKVTKRDQGCNFFLAPGSVGQPIAAEVARHIRELNPFCEPHSFETDYDHFVASGGHGLLFGDVAPSLATSEDPIKDRKAGFHRPSWNATHVIVSDRVPLPTLLKLSEACQIRNIGVSYIACNGQLAFMRTMSPDIPVVDTVPGPDDVVFDPRVMFPFPALQAVFDSLDPEEADLEKMSQHTFSHLPWPAIAYHAVRKWRAANGKGPRDVPDPKSFADRKALKGFIDALGAARGTEGDRPESFGEATARLFQIFSYASITAELKDIFAQAATRASAKSSAFWVFMAAVKSFYDEKGYLPLNPSLPDFTTTSDIYRSLAKAYKEQARAEAEDVFVRATAFLKAQGASAAEIAAKIHLEACANICANAGICQFMHYPALADEVGADFGRAYTFVENGADSVAHPDADCMRWRVKTNAGAATGSDNAAGWYAAVRAAWSYRVKHHGAAPGAVATEAAMSEPLGAVEEALAAIAAKQWQNKGDAAPGNVPASVKAQLCEMARYGGTEMGQIASIMGAVGSQELIKFVQHKRVPVTPWCIFDGNTSKFIQIDCAH